MNSGTPYIIYRRAPGAGFWSNFSCVLQGIDEADRAGYVPVVDMERHTTIYNDPGVGWTGNGWEQFFEQPGQMTVKEALLREPLDNAGNQAGQFTSILAARPPTAAIQRARELIERYIRVRPEILAQVDAVLPPGVHSDVLAVHVRGTDMRGHFPGHPIPNVISYYVELARELDASRQFSKVVLATDEIETVERFRSVFGERLLTIDDAHRTSETLVLKGDRSWQLDVPRELHRYRLGCEVLVDALLLSRCGHLVCGISNVSQSAIYFSDDTQVVYEVPPLWMTPELDGTSLGQRYTPARTTTQNPAVLHDQIGALRDLLAAAEKRGAARSHKASVRQRILKRCASLLAVFKQR